MLHAHPLGPLTPCVCLFQLEARRQFVLSLEEILSVQESADAQRPQVLSSIELGTGAIERAEASLK